MMDIIEGIQGENSDVKISGWEKETHDASRNRFQLLSSHFRDGVDY